MCTSESIVCTSESIVCISILTPGEHITSMYSEKEGRVAAIKGDQDVLNVNENEVIVVEIKD